MNFSGLYSDKRVEELLLKYYKDDNYKIINLDNDSDLCYVFFASHGLYEGRENVSSIEEFHGNDRFEWLSVATNPRVSSKAKKLIFLRDVFKLIYTTGVNEKINTIDKIVDFIKKETEGLRVIIAGSSGGGYMAYLLSGLLPNVVRVISLGGVLNFETLKEDSFLYNFIMKHAPYKDITHKVSKTADIINVYGNKNSYDVPNLDYLKESVDEEHLFLVEIETKMHAPSPGYALLVNLLSSSKEELSNLFKDHRIYIDLMISNSRV